ncbi:MAG: asparagine synthase [Rhodospirillales bacterium CG15_BIG_FIL_POST_REV_8_21_14_020_66_15]|nr:MAG: asparagine synthase [Rhodospirillales bacterium CG15_BIG_FIL_POST_REV_8_21_14_020_66_15]
MLHRLRDRLATGRLSPLARKVRGNNLTYLSPAKLLSLEAVLRRVRRNGADGDYLEFGVALGGSAIVIASNCPAGCTFHGYDVFATIPQPGPEDDARSHQRYVEISSGRSPGIGGDPYYGYLDNLYERVCRSFTAFGLPVDGVHVSLHKGLFEDTLDPADIRPVAFAHIDCDWYEPVRYCLDALRNRLTPGAIVVLDDYGDYGGCRKAVDLFLTKTGEFRVRRLSPHAVLERVRQPH